MTCKTCMYYVTDMYDDDYRQLADSKMHLLFYHIYDIRWQAIITTGTCAQLLYIVQVWLTACCCISRLILLLLPLSVFIHEKSILIFTFYHIIQWWYCNIAVARSLGGLPVTCNYSTLGTCVLPAAFKRVNNTCMYYFTDMYGDDYRR